MLATWCIYSDKGVSEQGKKLNIQDAMHEDLHIYAQKTAVNPSAFLTLTVLFGELQNDVEFTTQYNHAISKLYAPNSKIKLIMQTALNKLNSETSILEN